MVLDSSAVLAILLKEAERDSFAALLSDDPVRLISSVNAFESAVVLSARKGPAGARELDLLIHAAAVEIVPFAEEHLALAREAYRRYGKGRHPAGLNLGDCCAYALARHSGEPLLFKGQDLGKTDVPSSATS